MIIKRKDNIWEVPFSDIPSGQNFESGGLLFLKRDGQSAWAIKENAISLVDFKREDKVRPVDVKLEFSYATEI
ncbi:hypothetical protein [Pectobacterium phage Wc4-1]|uniref:Uncharacterized protein n=1 Tax=Pectobacterium phage Wc4 TaxID=2652428 RepID=A0A5P8D5Z0_9CAUD|nr:hypothetical protein [Pectobacterium phage Wc4]QFP93987.1 hypothetical protein [Pectobacterium phage Wc4-1]